MARSMMKRRQEAERQRNAAYEATLRRVFAAPRPAPDFDNALKEAKAGLFDAVLRPAHEWRPKLKTRDPGRLRLAAARHLFARYPVPAHLERIWLEPDGVEADEAMLRKRWYVAAARGDSLYKAGASQWLTRKEVHAFLNASGDLSFEQAFWLAIAGSTTDDPAIASRIARSKISRTPRTELGFWREAARFFCANPATVEEIDDLCDFIVAARERDRGFSLKGRTLASLRRLSAEWHRDMATIARIEAMRRRLADEKAMREARWAGSRLQDWTWQPPGKEAKARREEFVVAQLTSAEDLVAESRAMHHCVWSYAGKCIAGQASIWSLRHRSGKDVSRLLTIELDREDRAVQVRGFANRLASADERKILDRWAQARGVLL
ncbi:MAG: PcfJ domain-containing protein [Mesorhizobium sp.]|nr:PcfJ domain-containing protein [Mesorhizobium sp.]MCO5159846.1 PcfJ domain-containing protein [Mesorhizobium sp.]